MTEGRTGAFVGLFAFASACFFLQQVSGWRQRQFHYPPAVESLNSPLTSLQDVAGVALGFRRLAADIAWIQTLQYYGTPESGQSEQEFENGQGQYPEFLNYCRRVTALDPSFRIC